MDAFQTQIHVGPVDLTTHGLDTHMVAKCLDITPEQLTTAIERGWYPDGEVIDGRKVWHPDFVFVHAALAESEKLRGKLPKSWPVVDGCGPYLRADSGVDSESDVRPSQFVGFIGTVTLVIFPEISKVFFSNASDLRKGWDINKVAKHFGLTVERLTQLIQQKRFPDAILVEGKRVWHPGIIPIITSITEYCKSTGRMAKSWPAEEANGSTAKPSSAADHSNKHDGGRKKPSRMRTEDSL